MAVWSPDGTRVVSGDFDGTVHMWDSTTGQTLLTFQDMLQPVVWSPDGRLLASASVDNKYRWSVQVWEATSGKLLYCYQGHTHYVRSVTWSPDGNFLASASFEEVQIWAVHNNEGHLTYEHPGGVNDMAWSLGGKRIASAACDVRIWVAPH